VVVPEMIWSHEALVADGAAEVLLACVGAYVAGQLVWPRKLLAAASPLTRERTLTCSRMGQ
jgi:hypothetical protein